MVCHGPLTRAALVAAALVMISSPAGAADRKKGGDPGLKHQPAPGAGGTDSRIKGTGSQSPVFQTPALKGGGAPVQNKPLPNLPGATIGGKEMLPAPPKGGGSPFNPTPADKEIRNTIMPVPGGPLAASPTSW